MAAGFHQIPVHLNSVQKTAFVTNEGQYEYLAMPFGLRNAPSVFQRCITKALSHLKKKPLIYIDDALAYSVDISAGLQRLDEVLAALSEAGFSLNLKKCKFMKKKIDYLGYSVQSGETRASSVRHPKVHLELKPFGFTRFQRFLCLGIHIDFTGKLSGKSDRKEYCSVIIDAFTKYVLLEHTLSLDAKSAINALQKAVYLFGASKRIIADQGRCYISSDFKSFCDQYKIELHFIATGSSRANGQVERVMCTLKSILTIVENDPSKTWRDEPGNIQLALNSTKSTVTKYSPSELMFGIRSDSLGMSKINSTDKNNAVRLDLDSVREDASVKLPNLKLLDLTAVAQKLNHFLKIPRSDTDSADSRTMTASSDTMSAHSDPETWDVIHEVEIHSEEGNSLSQVGTAYLLYLLLDIYYVLCVTYVVNDLNGLKFVAKWLNMGEECRPN
ncbi:unnamed protein product [Euphydryas editha]|uniref:Integrase catalytic domain-containing protein n=1 Tax=Euphydryas editha TaxID=104508 RepID=A0AAU9VF05_EUPED|nr:unnamed protein product [Euphydryas editha]